MNKALPFLQPRATPPDADTASDGVKRLGRAGKTLWRTNLAKFRQNEVMCQHLFGKHWDPRYGRSRVRDHQTGGMLCWGDGETYLNMEVARSDGGAGGGVIDGHELRNTLRQDQRSLDAGGKPLPSERKGRVHLRGHPSGDVAHKTNDGYWRWLDPETAKGVDVKELKKLKK